MQFWSALATARQTRENFSPEMISRIAPTLLFVLATMVSAKELAVVQKDFQRMVRPIFQKFCFDCNSENKSKAGIRVDYLDGTVLDNTIVLYGSGASTTHRPENLPTLVAGGANMGLKHNQYWRNGKTQMSDVFLSILHSLGVEEETFADSTKAGAREVFTKA